jgi:hypothetical protein
VVFTSAHGENYPVRWNNHPKRLCYDPAANVPLIVSLPGTFSGGRRVADPVSVADLCPTIADLCGVAAPMNLHGESLRPLLAGVPERWRGEVFIQNTPFNRDKGGDADMREPLRGHPRLETHPEHRASAGAVRPPRGRAGRGEPLRKPETLDAARALAARMEAWAGRTGDTLASALVEKWAAQCGVMRLPALAALLLLSGAAFAFPRCTGTRNCGRTCPGDDMRTCAPCGRFVVNADGTGRAEVGGELADGPDVWTQFAGWSPDGRRAVVCRAGRIRRTPAGRRSTRPSAWSRGSGP